MTVLIVLILQILLASSLNISNFSDNNITNNLANNTSEHTEEANYDPNWLYSSIAQSSAAIIGIIGAFVTSKILQISGEKNSLSKRKAELELDMLFKIFYSQFNKNQKHQL